MYSEDEDFEEEEESSSKKSGFDFKDFINENKKMVYILVGLVLLFIVLSIAKGCKSTTSSSQLELTLDKEIVSVNVGGSNRVIPSINGSNTQTFIYTIDNTDIATVDTNGNITGVSLGNAILTVTYDNNGTTLTKNCTVNVVNGNENSVLTNIDFIDNLLIIGVGSEFQISPVSTPTDGYITSLVYSSTNLGVATIESNGLLKALSVGSTKININANNSITNTLNVLVVEDAVSAQYVKNLDNITLNSTTLNVVVGSSANIDYTLSPVDAYSGVIKWVSQDESIATVDNGIVTGVSEGDVLVNILVNDYRKGTVVVSVKATEVKPTSLEITSGESVTLEAGTVSLIQTNVLPLESTNKTCTYQTSNNSVATVSESGYISGISAGTAVITVTCGDLTKQISVTVTGSSNSSGSDYSGSDYSGSDYSGSDYSYDDSGSNSSTCSNDTCVDITTDTELYSVNSSGTKGKSFSTTKGGNNYVYTSTKSSNSFNLTINSSPCTDIKTVKYCTSTSGYSCTPSLSVTVPMSKNITVPSTNGVEKVMYFKFTVTLNDGSSYSKQYYMRIKTGSASSSSTESGYACWCFGTVCKWQKSQPNSSYVNSSSKMKATCTTTQASCSYCQIAQINYQDFGTYTTGAGCFESGLTSGKYYWAVYKTSTLPTNYKFVSGIKTYQACKNKNG